jgi:glycosyltransferase involved in cell wall biosynthesis
MKIAGAFKGAGRGAILFSRHAAIVDRDAGNLPRIRNKTDRVPGIFFNQCHRQILAFMNSDTKHPCVSIILPASGSADALAISLESLLCQTFTDIEVLLIDDGLCGSSAEIQPLLTDPRILVIGHPEQSGAGRALNTGISAARGDLVGFARTGDVWDARRLEEQVACFSSLSWEFGVVYSDVWEITPACNRAYRHSPDMDNPLLLNAYATDFQAADLGIDPILVRRAVLEKAGLFDEQLGVFAGTDMIIRLRRLCRFHHIRKPLCHRRSLPDFSDTPVDTSIARLLLLQKYPEVLHNPLFVALQAELIRRALWKARGDVPPSHAPDAPETEPGYYREPVPEL